MRLRNYPGASGACNFFPINAPGMGRFQLFDLVGLLSQLGLAKSYGQGKFRVLFGVQG